MAGPWEQFQTQPTQEPTAAKPWEKFSSPAEAAPPVAERKQPGIGEKALGALAAPGFAAAEVVSKPITSAKIVGQGILDYPKDLIKNEQRNVDNFNSGVKGAFEPNRSIGGRAVEVGKAGLSGLAGAFEPLTTGIENTYGRLAAEGSRMTQPDNKRLITPSTASILPTLFVGGGKEKPSTEFANAAQRFGMDFSKAKDAEGIAAEIGKSTDNYFSRIAGMIWDRTPSKGEPGKLGEIGNNAVKNFAARKAEESALWTGAETQGNTIARDHAPEIKRLQELRDQVATRIKNGEDTPDVKKSQAMIDRALGELGAPTTPGQQIIERTRDVGGKTQTTQASRQYAPKIENTTTKNEPTMVYGGKKFSETSQTPINRIVQQEGKLRAVETSPYSVTTRITKGEAAPAPRPGTAGDLVRARRAVNDSSYASADSSVSREVKDVLQNGLADTAKTNKEFSQTHTNALRKTQANADLYRDDAKATKFGFDEETLGDLRSKMKNGRDLSTATLEKINNGVDKIKTPEDLLFLQRHLDKPEFSMAMRAKASAILSDVGTDAEKIKDQRPMLEQIFKYSGISEGKSKQMLDDLETVSKEMKRYDIPTKPMVDPNISKSQRRMQSIMKALTFGGLFGNPKQGGFHAIQALNPSPNAAGMSLGAFKNAAAPGPGIELLGPQTAAMLGALGTRNNSMGNAAQGAITGPQQ